jgi:uncharacterized protein
LPGVISQHEWAFIAQRVFPFARIGKRYGEAAMAYKFEIYKDKASEFRFRFIAPNGEEMFGSQGYKQKSSATSAIDSIKAHAPGAAVEDQTK